METADECSLKPGERCAWCGYQKPAKKPAKARRVCYRCQQPFKRGQKWRLFRGRPMHEACVDVPEDFKA